MSCYFVANIRIHDPDTYQKYLDGYDAVFSKFEGTVVAVDDQPRVLEGSWEGTRVVLIRFPSEAAALEWYNSDAYQEIVRYRHQASTADILLVHGRDE
jgi:uncharacterized protein (DUF1330 family)